MSVSDYFKQKLAAFRHFEATLTPSQRQFLHQHPDLLSPDMVGVLFQIALSRVSHDRFQRKQQNSMFTVKSPEHSTEKKPRKVVNSWMAFRSYYSPLIKDLPQKVRSPMLAMLWKNDVDHALWELLSASYSYIRDNHGEDGVSLDQFLGVATQVVPVIPADQYFKRCGWARVGDSLQKVDVYPKELPKATNVSCAGLARYCFRQGLISKPPVTKQAEPKTYRSRQATPSHISFASMASTPLDAATTRKGQAQESPNILSALNDIEVADNELLEGFGFIGQGNHHGNSGSSSSNEAEHENGQYEPSIVTDSPFSATTGSDAVDISNIFNTLNFLADDFWAFSDL